MHSKNNNQKNGDRIQYCLFCNSNNSISDLHFSLFWFFLTMKRKFTKPQAFKIRESNPDDGICKCESDGIISENCLEIGISSSLHIIAVYRGVEINRSLATASLKNKRWFGSWKIIICSKKYLDTYCWKEYLSNNIE